jgi:hypothetical protein
MFDRRRSSEVPLAEQIYPYLVPQDYPDVLSTSEQGQRQIGHGLSVALVTPHGEPEATVLAGVDASRLSDAGLNLASAYAHADRALSEALSAGRVTLEFYDHGPAGAPMVVASGSWLAATALIAPQLHERMTRLLGDDIVAAVPHRDLMFLFNPESSLGMAEVIETEYSTGAKPLTAELFVLGTHGPQPLR